MFDIENLTLAAIVLVVAEIIGVLLAVDAVMRRRSSQGAVAWSVALVAMPVVTVPLYLVLGRTRFRGYAESLREAEAQVGESVADWLAAMSAVAAKPREGLAAIEAVARHLNGVPFTGGNRVELLVNAEATYGAMLEAVAAAESYVLVQFYIVRDDDTGRTLRDLLIEKARSGVRVYFLYDEIGSIKLPDEYLDPMRAASIEFSGFKTTQGFRNRFQINFRNHRKLLVVDGRTGFIGGHNLRRRVPEVPRYAPADRRTGCPTDPVHVPQGLVLGNPPDHRREHGHPTGERRRPGGRHCQHRPRGRVAELQHPVPDPGEYGEEARVDHQPVFRARRRHGARVAGRGPPRR